MKPKALLVLASILIACSVVLADDPPHHEDLNSMQLGSVHFPTSCEANQQANFER
jgi:hypothetical protein